MRIVCIGGGPAGLFLAICAKQREAGHCVTVWERDLTGAHHGWGLTYGEDLLDSLHTQDPELARAVRARSVVWRGVTVRVPDGGTAHQGGYGFSVSRTGLLDVLAQHARQLGVEVREGVAEEAQQDADVVVAADGAMSRIRQAHAELFGTRLESGCNLYTWAQASARLSRLMLIVVRTEAGLIWIHAYPSVAGMSTCVVECTARTWRALGLQEAPDGGRDILQPMFAKALRAGPPGGTAEGDALRWQRFVHVSNERWHHGNLVLIGDAAHTTHFSLGAGTTAALRDARALARHLQAGPNLDVALQRYTQRRFPAVARLQAEARQSMRWFERLEDFAHLDAASFAAALSDGAQGKRPGLVRRRLAGTGLLRLSQDSLNTVARWQYGRRRERRER